VVLTSGHGVGGDGEELVAELAVWKAKLALVTTAGAAEPVGDFRASPRSPSQQTMIERWWRCFPTKCGAGKKSSPGRSKSCVLCNAWTTGMVEGVGEETVVGIEETVVGINVELGVPRLRQ
jgi:hypothetical protein